MSPDDQGILSGEDIKWSYSDLGLKEAKEILESLAKFDVPENRKSFRDGIRYSFRLQKNFSHVFSNEVGDNPAAKNQWQPSLAGILGLDKNALVEFYEQKSKAREAVETLDESRTRIRFRAIDDKHRICTVHGKNLRC